MPGNICGDCIKSILLAIILAVKIMMIISHNKDVNLDDLPPPRLERETIFAHDKPEHHQGEDLACVRLVTMRMRS